MPRSNAKSRSLLRSRRRADRRPDTFTLTHRQAILASVAQHGVPAIHAHREAVVEGGLISYAPDSFDIFHRSTTYVDRILEGGARRSASTDTE